ncbi:MAG: exonuclease SbcCD subunit D [Bacteroidota bacterium]
MKFLHTADWHVGKTLRGRSRAEEHVAVLNEIVTVAKEHEVDAVLVVGDLFESSAPTAESERIVYNALLTLAQVTPQVVIISGNHDNQMRLDAIKPLLKLTNIHVVPLPSRPDEGGIYTFKTRTGERINVSLLPFLSQRSIIRAAELLSGDGMTNAQTYSERAIQIIDSLCKNCAEDSVNIFLAHAMVQGGVLGGGERLAHTVFEYSIPTNAFPSMLHYVALGHLHRVQKLQGACPIWYSGSPLALDFSEINDVKSVNIVEAKVGKPVKVESIAIQSGKKLRIVRGTFDYLNKNKEDFGDDFLKVELTESPVPGIADQVRELLPNAIDVRIIHPMAKKREKFESRTKKSPQDLFAQYLKERDEDNQDLKTMFSDLLEEIHASSQA